MIQIIGMPQSGRAGLGPILVGRVLKADLLAGGGRHLAEFPDYAGRTVLISGRLDELRRAIKGVVSRRPAARVAVLATGDPLLYGIAAFLIDSFGRSNVEVLPAPSVVQEALARIRRPWSSLTVLSGHGRTLDGLEAARKVGGCDVAAFFTDAVNTPASICAALIGAGLTGYKAHVCESLGASDERVRSGALSAVARMRGFKPLNVLVLEKEAGIPESDVAPSTRGFGLPDFAFVHSKGMITKPEVRAVSLSKLALSEKSTVWDVGAGCGSVAVEAALMARKGRVFAFEKSKARAALINRNKKRFNAANLAVFHGEAPAVFADSGAARPDAVFIGGGGAALARILAAASKRALPGATFVVNAVTMESASTAAAFFKRRGMRYELIMMSVAREEAAGPAMILKAGNPIFIVSAGGR